MTRKTQTVLSQLGKRRSWLLGGGVALVLLGLGALLVAFAFCRGSKRSFTAEAPAVREPEPAPPAVVAHAEPRERPAPMPTNEAATAVRPADKRPAAAPSVSLPPVPQPPAPPPPVLKPVEMKPAASLRQEKPQEPSRVIQPVLDGGLSELARVLERKENLSAFEGAVKGALRDANAEGNALDSFVAEMKKVKGKAPRFVNEMRLTKGAANVSADFIVDLQYALKAADVVRKRLAVRPRLLADWDALKNGDDKSADVRKATSRLILGVPELLK